MCGHFKTFSWAASETSSYLVLFFRRLKCIRLVTQQMQRHFYFKGYVINQQSWNIQLQHNLKSYSEENMKNLIIYLCICLSMYCDSLPALRPVVVWMYAFSCSLSLSHAVIFYEKGVSSLDWSNYYCSFGFTSSPLQHLLFLARSMKSCL